jgi:SAM-dependent methyltransferase
MSSAADHYANLLAPYYTWMFGVPFADKVAEQQAVLSKAFSDTAFTPSGQAIDLGSGPGFQSFALANLGFTSVLAVDSSSTLLHELDSHLAHQPVRTALADIRDLPKLTAPGSASAIVCMGDTLTHLPAKSDVATLFRDAYGALAPGGVLILTWRDLTPELSGADRFIPVRSDDSTIMTCFLEYDSPDTVQVHDLIYSRQPDTQDTAQPPSWILSKSSYPKLRLSPEFLTTKLTQTGFKVNPQSTAGRLLLLSANRP